ncbi:hypothetical protein BsWGS_01050 [Bradybaena similaris]
MDQSREVYDRDVSPNLFSLYSENMKNFEDMRRIMIERHNINNIRCADDTVLIAVDLTVDLVRWHMMIMIHQHTYTIKRPQQHIKKGNDTEVIKLKHADVWLQDKNKIILLK